MNNKNKKRKSIAQQGNLEDKNNSTFHRTYFAYMKVGQFHLFKEKMYNQNRKIEKRTRKMYI